MSFSHFFRAAPVVTATPSNGTVNLDVKTILHLAENIDDQAKCLELRKALRAFFSGQLVDDIPSYDKPTMLMVLLLKEVWPSYGLEPIPYKESATMKDQFIELILSDANTKNTKINAGLQAMCKNTFLGAVFHEQRRYWWAPDLSRGRLKTLADKLEELVRDKERGSETIELSKSTQEALKNEAKRNPYFASNLMRYPQLCKLARPHTDIISHSASELERITMEAMNATRNEKVLSF